MKIIYCVGGQEVLVDDENYDYLNSYKWYFHKSDGYAYRNLEQKRNSKRIQMHRDIMKCESNLEIDHINGNKLDNQKKNLRSVAHKINQRNRKIPSNNKTGYMGVWKQGNKFVAEIRKDNIKYYIGIFITPIDAALAYDAKAKEFGFDHLNFKEKNV